MKKIFQSTMTAFLHTALGYWLLKVFLLASRYRVFSARTVHAMEFDLLRAKARMTGKKIRTVPAFPRLHFGCGSRRVKGWLNVDISGSDQDIDLAAGFLPWNDAVFEAVASQHVIEHLELTTELFPLMRELRRVCVDGAEIWLSCPDLEKVCASYSVDRARGLLEDRDRHRDADAGMDGIPTQHYINLLMTQRGEHKNLFDYEMLKWLLSENGFSECRRAIEEDFLSRFPEFPKRSDDSQTLYVCAVAI